MLKTSILFTLAAILAADTVSYKYDDAGRLVSAIYGNGTTVAYSYDKAGNLLTRTTTGSSGSGSPSVVGAQPTSGKTDTQSFTFQFSHTAGYQSLSVVNILINNFLDGRRACYLAYIVSSSTLVLVDDEGNAGGPYAGAVAVGNPATAIENSQCAVNLTSAVGSGSTLTLTLGVRFKAAFGGNKIQFLAARDGGTGNTDWQAMGVWQAPFTPSGTIAVTGTSPARIAAAAGTAQTVTLTLTDTKGAGDFGVINLLMNRFIDGRQGCYLAYLAGSNALVLVDDAGNAGGPFAGTMVLNGAAATIENSQCAVNGSASSAVSTGNTLTLTLRITAKAAFTGNRVLWVAGRDQADGNNTDWQSMGTWSVQ